MSTPKLTVCLAGVVSASTWPNDVQPILQILDVQQAAKTKNKIHISDGVSRTMAVVDNSFKIEKFDIIKVAFATFNVLKEKNRTLLIIVQLEKLQSYGSVIGNPTSIQPGSGNASSESSPPANKSAPATSSNLPARGNQTRASTANSKNAYTPTSGSKKGPISTYASNYGSISESDAVPIASLNNFHNNWVIKGRVTTKSEIKEWNKPNGSGKLFSVDLIDSNKDEIRCVAFGDAVDKFYGLFTEGSIFLVAKGKLKYANNKFSNLKSTYEITLDTNSIVELVENDKTIPEGNYNIVPLSKLKDLKDDDIVDVAGLVSRVDECKPFNTKAGKATYRRNIYLTAPGSSKEAKAVFEVTLTMWGTIAQNIPVSKDSVVVCKGVRKSSYDGISLSTISTSTIVADANLPEVQHIKGWYQTQLDGGVNVTANVERLSKRVVDATAYQAKDVIAVIKDLDLGSVPNGPAINSRVRATVTHIKKSGTMYYDACPKKDCHGKKVTADDNGGYTCKSCGHVDVCQRRYLMKVMVSDHTGSIWATVFNDVAELIMGEKADHLAQIKEANDDDSFTKIITMASYGSFKMSIKAQMEEGRNGEEPRPKYTIMNAQALNFREEGDTLLKKIKEYEGDAL